MRNSNRRIEKLPSGRDPSEFFHRNNRKERRPHENLRAARSSIWFFGGANTGSFQTQKAPVATIRANLSRPRRNYPVRDRRGRGERVEFVPTVPAFGFARLGRSAYQAARAATNILRIRQNGSTIGPARTSRASRPRAGASLCITHARGGSDLLTQPDDANP